MWLYTACKPHKKRLNIPPTNFDDNFDSFSMYILSKIYKTASNFEKEIFKIGLV